MLGTRSQLVNSRKPGSTEGGAAAASHGTPGKLRQRPHRLTNVEAFQGFNNWHSIPGASPAWKGKYGVTSPFLGGRDVADRCAF